MWAHQTHNRNGCDNPVPHSQKDANVEALLGQLHQLWQAAGIPEIYMRDKLLEMKSDFGKRSAQEISELEQFIAMKPDQFVLNIK